uniref:Uncharacterized protein n=1 Tax=Globisporangium ultimum (strain ATCC 200006 / CBS 805.95 / DAOM BR144) TaxID=431595 RepID=K3WHD4_GLOUD
MFIKVKRDFPGDFIFQAISELIALNLLADGPVMGLMTNLTDVWMVLWVGERRSNISRIKTANLTRPNEAFQVIRTMLPRPPYEAGADDNNDNLPYLREWVKRRKLKPMLLSAGKDRERLGRSRKH